MKRFILPSICLTILLLMFTPSMLAKEGDGQKGGNQSKGNNAKGNNGHHQGDGHRGGQGRNNNGRYNGNRGGHGHGHHGHGHRYRPNWGFGWGGPPMYPYRGGWGGGWGEYYRPYRPMPPRPYMRPYGGYYNNGDFGFFFNF